MLQVKNYMAVYLENEINKNDWTELNNIWKPITQCRSDLEDLCKFTQNMLFMQASM